MIKQFLTINKFFFGDEFAWPNSCFSGISIPNGKKIKKNINQSMKTTTKKETMLIELYWYEYLLKV